MKNKPSDKRARILKGAAKIFAKHGFSQARTAAIAREARVAEGTIYNYFKSKDDLILTIFEETWRALIDRLKQSLPADMHPIEKLAIVLNAIADLFEDDPLIAEVFLVEFRQCGKCFSDQPMSLIFEFLDLLEEILKEGIARGVVRRDVSTKIARSVLFGAVENVLLGWLLRRTHPEYFKDETRPFTLAEAKDDLMKLLGTGLFSVPGGN
jgi:TetR/AcrR family fatty acid metabolism transcriptional regulator